MVLSKFVFYISVRVCSVFKADEKKYCFETNRANVTVIGSIGQHTHGSSKVKLKSFVDYKWEVRNYPGRLVAVHIDGKHIAYAIKGNFGTSFKYISELKTII